MADADGDRVVREDADAEHVQRVRIDRPDKRNALDGPTRVALVDALEAAVDEGARAIVLTGTGSTFASGADLEEMQARSVAQQRAALQPPRMYEAIEGLERPVVAAVNGHALGAGLELALACDVRVASSSAKLGSPEVRLGLIPGGGATQRLPRLVGMGEAMKMILTGDAIEAQRAREAGLVQVLAEDAVAAAMDLAGRMARWSPVALAAAKRAIRDAWRSPLAEGLGREADAFADVFGSHDAREGIAAFLEDREPKFEGR